VYYLGAYPLCVDLDNSQIGLINVQRTNTLAYFGQFSDDEENFLYDRLSVGQIHRTRRSHRKRSVFEEGEPGSRSSADGIIAFSFFVTSGASIIKLITVVIHGFRNKPESLTLNTRLGWKDLPGTNTLTYYGNSKLQP
jgi:hypothetical protein